MDWFKEKGWGYKDTEFVIDEATQEIGLTGDRYLFSGDIMPNFKQWAIDFIGIDLSQPSPPKDTMLCDPPILCDAFLQELGNGFSRISFDDKERIVHSHGQTIQEIYDIQQAKLARTADVVIYPRTHEQVEKIVELAVKHDVVVIPYGGGTNVTYSVLPEKEEKRMIVSLDMSRLNHVKWVDKVNMTACIEAGILGQDLERELKK